MKKKAEEEDYWNLGNNVKLREGEVFFFNLHYGIRLSVNGSVNLQVRGGSAGVIETLVGVAKPISIVNKIIEVRPSGKIASGTSEIPFSMNIKQPEKRTWKGSMRPSMEQILTFRCIFLSLKVKMFSGSHSDLRIIDISRGYLHKSLSTTMEFIVESDKADLLERPVSPEMVIFYLTQDTQRHPLLPELKSGGFRVIGKMSTQCCLSDPIVESILLGEKIVTEQSLIQTTQIADGDVCRNMTLPIYVILPRLLTCPTVLAGPFSIEFKVAVVITFQSDVAKVHSKSDPTAPRLWLAMESLPLELVRTR
ncbi:Down syndrome critical region protein 3 homolog [Prunus yedoensis var. nudiflora]|uniref:Down syndrome critical region protein 3 homolog n=1 Tax=Prunus yedoensis var. nudiflora TaxID=2094558 RepID=A0A314ZBN5_PRUYE|nr:Down syndrome critical region protein 3 homolog [Prunus yedoensis var. nudiflora]